MLAQASATPAALERQPSACWASWATSSLIGTFSPHPHLQGMSQPLPLVPRKTRIPIGSPRALGVLLQHASPSKPGFPVSGWGRGVVGIYIPRRVDKALISFFLCHWEGTLAGGEDGIYPCPVPLIPVPSKPFFSITHLPSSSASARPFISARLFRSNLPHPHSDTTILEGGD